MYYAFMLWRAILFGGERFRYLLYICHAVLGVFGEPELWSLKRFSVTACFLQAEASMKLQAIVTKYVGNVCRAN